MGLQTWKNSPDGRVLKSDVAVAKNYLIEREIPFTMQQFAGAVNEFLEFRKYQVLDGKGKISHEQAERKAFAEYDVFNKTQKIESDFDKLVKKTNKGRR